MCVHAFLSPDVPMLAATASVTESMRRDIIDKLNMSACCVVSISPNKKNIYYQVVRKSIQLKRTSVTLYTIYLSTTSKPVAILFISNR